MKGLDASWPFQQRVNPRLIWPLTPGLPSWLQDAVMQYPQKPVLEQVKAFQLSLERMLDLGNSKRWTLYCTLAAWLQNQVSSKQEAPSSQLSAKPGRGPSMYSFPVRSRPTDIAAALGQGAIPKTFQELGLCDHALPLHRAHP